MATPVILSLLSLPILLTTAYLSTAHLTRARFPLPTNKRICLLTAHPDDEAMFFAPALLALTDPAAGNHVKILCLSTGNADGLGTTRKKELLLSAAHLGIRAPEKDVLILDSPSFPDGMSETWSADAIAEVLASAFVPASAAGPIKKSKSSISGGGGRKEPTIDILLTFDRDGISGHKNHTALHAGALLFLHHLASTSTSSSSITPLLELYTLTTLPLVRKYLSFLDIVPTLLLCTFAALTAKRRGAARKRDGERLVFVSGGADWLRGAKAMVKGHWSQMRWFRWGWVGLGRYMVVNELRRV
ncbi:N-acetylglucosaminyl-phosphatidylinositol de-N-acetylase [Toensbergia leucococca]|nr:N-acetylglucosaminyl-phosphatidylinositol de-N-acetylase [Toensbergia leucococca]